MRILVIGANGLIGSYVTARLLAEGHTVTGAGRDLVRARQKQPNVRWITADLTRMSPEEWREHLREVDAVINCAGALQDGPHDDLEGVHVRGVEQLTKACLATGVRRLVHVSAVGVDRRGSHFNATKARADALIAKLDLDWIILRPGLVLAPAAYGGSALLRALAGFPWFIPAAYSQSVVQVVAVDEVAACAVRAIHPETPARFVATLISRERTTLEEVLRALRGWLGIAPAPVLDCHPRIAAIAGGVCDALAWLGWRTALRSTAQRQLRNGVEGQPDDGARTLQFNPKSLETILSEWPSGIQERWFARLYLLKPVVMVTLALFWIVSGMVTIFERAGAEQILVKGGFTAPFASSIALAGALTDIALGLLACTRRGAGLAMRGMIVVTLAYLAAANLWRPDLWLDPLGPLVKAAPALVVALVGIAVLEER